MQNAKLKFLVLIQNTRNVYDETIATGGYKYGEKCKVGTLKSQS